MKDERKKLYSFRFGSHVNNQLSMLASNFHMDRTEMLEYMITVWATMWTEKPEEQENNETEILE